MTPPEPVVWRGFTRAALDAAYDNMAAVPDSAARLADWTARSQSLRAATSANTLPLAGRVVRSEAEDRVGVVGRPETPTPNPSPQGGGESSPPCTAQLDIPYGPRPRNRIDLFRCGREGAALLVFIHGGYWQRNAKEMFACMAEGPLALGLDVALPGYTLAPEAGLTEIAAEIRAALELLAGRADRIVVSGWSAGGHLAALALEHEAVSAALAISGVFDLEPIKHSYLDEKLRLSAKEVAQLSPIRRALPAKPLVCAYGLRELPELQRQSRDFVAAAGAPATLLPLAGHDHFSILGELASPGGGLALAARDLAAA
jgi:acetyl esterase/lipase